MLKRILLSLFFVTLLAGCASSYGSAGMTGGYTEKELEPGILRVVFGGNGYTNAETAQTFWLYRCAELALERGYDGFEILSPINLTSSTTGDSVEALLWQAQYVYVPMYMESSPKPTLQADIRLIKKPFEVAPPRVFDAAALKAELEVYVKGQKCDNGNVCPHVHRYLYPVGPTNDPV